MGSQCTLCRKGVTWLNFVHNVTFSVLNSLKSTKICLFCMVEQKVEVVQTAADHGI